MNDELIEQEEILEEIPLDDNDNDVVSDEQEVKVQETVPLHVLLDEKKRRKELEKKLRELEEKDLENDILTEKQRIMKRYTDRGYDEEIAELIAEDQADTKAEIKRLKANRSTKDPIDEDLEDLSKDSFYSDAMAYSKEIKSKISEFSKKGIELSAEDAYNLVRNPKLKLKELKETEEQQEIVARRGAVKKTIPNASTSSPKNPYPLDDIDKKALAGLQRTQPNVKWTAEKYYKLRYQN